MNNRNAAFRWGNFPGGITDQVAIESPAPANPAKIIDFDIPTRPLAAGIPGFTAVKTVRLRCLKLSQKR